MSNPQTENGYTRIVNELLEALYRFEFSKCEYQIILAIIRKTYGYHKKADSIGNTQLAQMTGIERSNVARTIRSLIEKNILLRNTDTYTHTVGINKHYDEWNLMEKSSSQSKKSKKTVVTGDHSLQESMVISDHSLPVSMIMDDHTLKTNTGINNPVFEQSVVKNGDFSEQSVVTGDTPSVVKFKRFIAKSVVTRDTYKRKVKESERKTTTTTAFVNNTAQKKNSSGGSDDFSVSGKSQLPENITEVLVFPRQLSAIEQQAARQLLVPCGAQAQDVLDVLAAAIGAGRVQTSPLALLGGLVRRLNSGAFDSTPGLKIKIEREKVNRSQQPAKPKAPIDREKNKQNLAAFRRNTQLR
ncbi:replication protein [Methylobacter sp. S3L5C]|uniref:replication protein n=1 Tax=Methylobacter sp. S3L5C TaxID=2839024 RepID=UPI001FAD0DA5|nr:replication protein [Methylobacter sp. S3L5C]UOA08467.1 replication protein [Methylobacter sp. S3L5C]